MQYQRNFSVPVLGYRHERGKVVAGRGGKAR